MRKLPAHFLRWLHLIYHLVKLDTVHCALSEGIFVRFLGIEIWFVEESISCTCGKTWYKK